MSAAREELAELLEGEQESGRWAQSPDADLYGFMATAVLNAGYRKPRTITTAEELEGLADGSVVMESQPDAFAGINVMAGVFHKFPHTGWQCVASYKCYGSAEIDLPATVLYEPTQ